MPATKGMTVAVAGYMAVALLAGALAAGSQRDGASASPSKAPEAGAEKPGAAEDARFPSLEALLYSEPQLSVARSFLYVSGLAARLEDSSRRHTLFAPVDRAFADQQGVSDALARPTNARELKRVLAFHVARGSGGLSAGANLQTLDADRLPIRSDGRRWWAQDAEIVGGPLRFPGGRVYLVDALLLAPGQVPPL